MRWNSKMSKGKKSLLCFMTMCFLSLLMIGLHPNSTIAAYAAEEETDWRDYAADGYDGGDGTMEAPYEIRTPEQLARFSKDTSNGENQFFILTDDIDMQGHNWYGKIFNGNFDGKGHKIKNLKITSSRNKLYRGFICSASPSTVSYIQNLTFENVEVVGADVSYVGVIAGAAESVYVENCHVINGIVKGKEKTGCAGGLFGQYSTDKRKSESITMSRCSSTATVTGPNSAGGLVGKIFYGNNNAGSVVVKDCYVGGLITGGNTGGIFGNTSYVSSLVLERCYVSAEITGNKNSVGGITGTAMTTGGSAIGVLKVSNSVAECPSVTDNVDTGITNSGRLFAKGSSLDEIKKGEFKNNYALDSMRLNGVTAQESINNGDNVSKETLSKKEFWADTLGFNFDDKGNWTWDDGTKRPVLNQEKQGTIEISIQEQPKDATAYNNQPALFAVEAAGGTKGYLYQWQYSSDNKTWIDIEEGTEDCLSVSKTDAFGKNNYYFKCIVRDNTNRTIESESAKLTVADAKYSYTEARKKLIAYYEKNKKLSYAGEAFALSTANVDISDYDFDILTYNGYFSQPSSASNTNLVAYLFLDAYARGEDITAYLVTGGGAPRTENMLNELLKQQNADTGRLSLNQNGYGVVADYIDLTMALDMYYAGMDKWGNEEEGTQKGRNGAIEYLLSQLEDYTGGGKYYSRISTSEKDLTAQGDFVLMMSRLVKDKTYGNQAKAAMEDVLECMENLYDSDKIIATRTAARYVSAFIAGADMSSSSLKRNEYLNIAQKMMNELILTSVASDGSYSSSAGQNAKYGQAEASAAVLLAFTDFKNEKSVFTTYHYEMSDEEAIKMDAQTLSVDNPVVTDLALDKKGTFGSTITWTSSRPSIINAETGAVTRSEEDKFVILTATVTKGKASVTKEFELTVKADTDGNNDAVDAVLKSLKLPKETYEDLVLPGSSDESVTVEWSSSDETVITSDGKIIRPAVGEKDAEVTMTATVSRGEVVKTKKIPVVVLAQTGDKAKMAYYESRAYWLKTKHISGYWNVFAAYAALGDYIQDPENGYTFELARPDSSWYGTQYGATVMAIVAMGENPYNYNGTNWVEVLKKNYGGMYAAPLYSQLGMNAAGADKADYPCGPVTSSISPASMSMGIDIAGWAAVNVADHRGEPGVDEAVQKYIQYLKDMGMAEDGNIKNSNYISSGCALMGFAALMEAGYTDCDAALPPWVNETTGKSIIDVVYDNNFGTETIAGYATQAQVSICDYYNVKYNNGTSSWIACRVSKERLQTQIEKAKAILANESKYSAASIETLKKALEAANNISASRLNEKIADYGEEYYALYDAVRYIKLKSEDEPDAAKNMTVKFRLIGDDAHDDGKHDSYITWIPTTEITLEGTEATVYDVFVKALADAGLKEEGSKNNYVSRIQAPSVLGSYWLGEFDNGKYSGWMFTVNGTHPQSGLKNVSIKDGDSIIWHYIDDYTVEEEKNTWLEAPDVAPSITDKPDDNTKPDGNTTKPDNNTTNPNGNTTKPDNSTANPNGNTTKPDNSTTNPNGNTTKPDNTTQAENPITTATKAVKAIKMTSLKAKKYKKTGVTLTWKSSKSNYKLNGYKVYRSTKKNSGYKLIKTVKGNKLTIKKGLKSGKNYYYRVRGYRKINGKVVYTKYKTIIVNLNKKTAIKTLKLPGLKAKATKGKVTLTWNDHMSMYKLKGYRIYQSTKKTKGYKKVASVKQRKAVIKKGLKKGKTYYFKVRGIVKIGKKTVYTKPAIIKVKAK